MSVPDDSPKEDAGVDVLEAASEVASEIRMEVVDIV